MASILVQHLRHSYKQTKCRAKVRAERKRTLSSHPIDDIVNNINEQQCGWGFLGRHDPCPEGLRVQGSCKEWSCIVSATEPFSPAAAESNSSAQGAISQSLPCSA